MLFYNDHTLPVDVNSCSYFFFYIIPMCFEPFSHFCFYIQNLYMINNVQRKIQ